MIKRIFSSILTIAFVFTLVSAMSASASTFTPVTGWDMTQRLGAGITFGNTTEARAWPWDTGWNPQDTETCWGQPRIERRHLQAAADRGFDSYRLCVTWTPHIDAEGKISKQWSDRIKQLVDWSLDAGLNVIINTHHEEELYYMIRDGKYEDAKKHLSNIWTQVAEQFKNYPETLIFEIMNEPNIKDHYGADDDKWINDENGQVDRTLRETVNKLNADILSIIRASGGNNDRRVVMLCVPGAHPDALPYMSVPENDPYIVLGVFGYDAFINDDTIPLIQAWLDKGVGVVNKEDAPGSIARKRISDLESYTKSHFGRLADMGVPSFWFTGSPSPHQLFDRKTREWKNESLLNAYLAAYEKKSDSEKLTTTDALNILKSVVGSLTLTAEQFANYDTNGDGKVDTADALMILKIVAEGS
ncbi:MAG: cellulase family glycosylhydrolase [Oscillospiraceae bacterium]|nr:cellulase family glycosylhydrolase [Oscillospiraceae bacterium]